MEQNVMMDKAKEMIEQLTDLPTIPVVATKVIALLDNPDTELDEVADMILTDQVLAARVIKVVNSPLYAASQEIKSVKRALIYLGFRHIRELILTCSFIEAFQGREGALNLQSFWEHSFGVGVVARIIAQRSRYVDSEKAYIAGIIHDIGEVFLSNYYTREFSGIIETAIANHELLYEVEKRTLGTTHCELGYCIAEKWRFPADYREIVSLHHHPEEAAIDPTLVAIVNLADLFCSVRQLDYGGKEWITFSLADQPAWDILRKFAPHMQEMDVERFCYELDDRVPEIQDLVRSIFASVTQE
ncbi:MAG: HDOD domain-containing protein [Desulfuromonadia bacterium]